jgi:steroid delta-isomerase-like uncharacterized protein
MSEANHALVRRWFNEVWTEGKESTIDELYAPGCVAHGLGDTEADVHGPEEFKQFWRNLRSAIPDVRVDVEDSVAEAHKAAVRVLLTGTHTGYGLGVEPTGRRVRIQGVILVHIRDGRIVEGWNSYDQLGLLRQIGALPSEGGPDRFLTATD